MRTSPGCLLALIALATWTAPLAAAEKGVKRLHILPERIELSAGNLAQQLVVTAEDEKGRLFDVTGLCSIAPADPIVSLVGSVVQASQDGETVLRVRYGPAEAAAPVFVRCCRETLPIHFATDLAPLFSKHGCNSGGCHGKQSGQNGFKLSVFGFDPAADYSALVKEARGRRLFPAAPERSLLVQKALGVTPHGGGRRIEENSLDHALLLGWIRQGMPWGDERAPKLVGLVVEPAERTLGLRARQQLLATALYSDGARRDVTAAASYTSNAENVAEVEAGGLVHSGESPGEAAITVNYMGQVGVSRVLVPRPGSSRRTSLAAQHNRIDELVLEKLDRLGIEPAGLIDDATFLRRLYLDAIGTLPDPDEVRAFLADREPNKRGRAVEAVLERREFADFWALKWADILLVDREQLGERGAFEFQAWLRESFSRNRPYDEWVRELLTSAGDSSRAGPVNFYRVARTPEDLTKAVSQAFLGLRLDCAQCHHHPFDKWSQEDFYALAGFFAGLERRAVTPGRELVFFSGPKEVSLPLSGKVVLPRPPGGKPLPISQDADPRISLADWVTSPENPWFARLIANRLWKHFLGRGLVEPEDDMRATNPAVNEPLLAHLAEQVAAGGYNLKRVMRLILNSQTYQRSSDVNETNQDDEQNFSHHLPRRLSAEVLLDAICHATGAPENYPGLPRGTRAIELWDNRLPSYFLDTFGRSERKTPCECAKSSEPTMAQALHLMNAPEIEAKITNPTGRVARLIAAGHGRDALVEELCLATLGRQPNEKEKRLAANLFARQPPRQAAEDFLWALLNSYDFLFEK